MGTFQELHLRWNGFEANARVAWRELQEEKVFQDVTLVAGDGRQVQANKVALAAGSLFFHKIITENPHPHPLIYLKGVSFTHLLSVLDFLYTGEATIDEANLNQFMDVAEDLKIKGLLPTALQTKLHPSSTSPQSQGTTQDLGPSPRVSYATSRTPASQVKVDIKDNATSASISRHYSVISAPLRDQSVAEEAAISPGISRPHNEIPNPLQNLLVNEEFAPLPRVSRPPRVEDGEPNLNREKCSFCTKTFAESSELEKHKMSHTSENPLQCPVCNKVFSSRGNLNIHKQIHAEKQFQCLVCFKRFTQKESLNKHNRTHTGEKPYECLVCFKRFARGSTLNKHYSIHTGEKPYECLVCFKRFSHVDYLNKHNKIHTGEKP